MLQLRPIPQRMATTGVSLSQTLTRTVSTVHQAIALIRKRIIQEFRPE